MRQIFGGWSSNDGLRVCFSLFLKIFDPSNLMPGAIFSLKDRSCGLSLKSEYFLTQFYIEAHLSSRQYIISSDDKNIIFGLLKMMDVFDGVFFKRRSADEKSTEFKIFFTILSFFVFVV